MNFKFWQKPTPEPTTAVQKATYDREEVDRIVSKAVYEERRWHEQGGATDFNEQGDNFLTGEGLLEELIAQGVTKNIAKKIVLEATSSAGWITYGLGLDQHITDLHIMQDAVSDKYYTDPHCRSIINNWTNYTIGGGIKVTVDDEQVAAALATFRVKNKMLQREKKFIEDRYKHGELFIVYYENLLTGDIKLRHIRPKEIEEIETAPNDIEERLAYHWVYESSKAGSLQTYSQKQWLPDITYKNSLLNPQPHVSINRSKKVKARKRFDTYVQFIRVGESHEIRGRVPLQPVLRFLKYYEDWLIDRIRLNHERAKVVWIKEVSGNKSNATTRDRRPPRGGIILVEDQDVKYRIESPKLDAADAKEDGMAILYTIGAGTSMPIHILNQRSDQQVYASIRKADTPFSQWIRSQQELWEEEFLILYREVIRALVKAGALKNTSKVNYYQESDLTKAFDMINRKVVAGVDTAEIIEEVSKALAPQAMTKTVPTIEIPLSIHFPEIIREDAKSQAEVLKIHKELGIASLSTLSAKAGYNWKMELSNMLIEHNLHKSQEPTKDEDPTDEKGIKKNDKE